jgi:hypothetical protein
VPAGDSEAGLNAAADHRRLDPEPTSRSKAGVARSASRCQASKRGEGLTLWGYGRPVADDNRHADSRGSEPDDGLEDEDLDEDDDEDYEDEDEDDDDEDEDELEYEDDEDELDDEEDDEDFEEDEDDDEDLEDED